MLKTPPLWLTGHERITTLLIGCGGTGSAMAEHLVRLHQAMIHLEHKGLAMTFADDDHVMLHNLGRQRFRPEDISKNKAFALAGRLNREHGTDIVSLTRRIEPDEAQLAAIQLFVTAVDDPKIRLALHDYLRRKRRDVTGAPWFWLDMGNGADFGQIVLGSPWSKTIAELADLGDIVPDGPSCSAEESLRRQELFINTHMAGLGAELLWRAFRYGFLEWNAVWLNAKNLDITKNLYMHT